MSAASAAAMLLASGVAAQTAPAGTPIDNVAAARWTVADVVAEARSNADRLIVAERLDVALAAADPAPAADGRRIASMLLSNTGNGREAFVVEALAASGALPVAIDADGDGRFDPARDAILPQGRTAPLDAGATIRLFALGDPAAIASVVATATTGHGTPGSVFAGLGDGGGDAVVGATGAVARLGPMPADSRGEAGRLLKRQTVRAPDGSDRPVSGATITYSLEASFVGAAPDAIVEDRVPEGTRYVADSLRLDGAGLTDAADGDAGELTDGLVRVRLGDAIAGDTRTVTFAVTLP